VSVEDEVAALRSRMETTSREHSERAALSTRNVEQAVAEGKEKTEKALRTAAAVATRLHERGVKEKAAGGWGTEAATKEKSNEFHFGGEEDEEPQDDFARYRSPSEGRAPAPEVVPEPPPAPPQPATPAWAPAAGRGAPARRPQRPVVDDDDDLSGQSWLT